MPNETLQIMCNLFSFAQTVVLQCNFSTGSVSDSGFPLSLNDKIP